MFAFLKHDNILLLYYYRKEKNLKSNIYKWVYNSNIPKD